MLNRCKQFFSALNPEFNDSDFRFVQSLLTPAELALFKAMEPIDQKHCIDVARSCELLAISEPPSVNRTLLYKAALLHDIGKSREPLGLTDRVAIVLLQNFLPWLYNILANKSHGPCFIAKNHPAIGAKMCREAGCTNELVVLVELHQAGGSGRELELLIQADQQN